MLFQQGFICLAPLLDHPEFAYEQLVKLSLTEEEFAAVEEGMPEWWKENGRLDEELARQMEIVDSEIAVIAPETALLETPPTRNIAKSKNTNVRKDTVHKDRQTIRFEKTPGNLHTVAKVSLDTEQDADGDTDVDIGSDITPDLSMRTSLPTESTTSSDVIETEGATDVNMPTTHTAPSVPITTGSHHISLRDQLLQSAYHIDVPQPISPPSPAPRQKATPTASALREPRAPTKRTSTTKDPHNSITNALPLTPSPSPFAPKKRERKVGPPQKSRPYNRVVRGPKQNQPKSRVVKSSSRSSQATGPRSLDSQTKLPVKKGGGGFLMQGLSQLSRFGSKQRSG